jgi:hypothetical protein
LTGDRRSAKKSGGIEDMGIIAVLFGLLLITGLSFGGNSFFGSVSSIAQDDPAGEAPGGDMKDEASNGSGDETGNTDKAATKGEEPGGDMTDEASNGSGAETGSMDKSAEGEMPGGDMPDKSAK